MQPLLFKTIHCIEVAVFISRVKTSKLLYSSQQPDTKQQLQHSTYNTTPFLPTYCQVRSEIKSCNFE